MTGIQRRVPRRIVIQRYTLIFLGLAHVLLTVLKTVLLQCYSSLERVGCGSDEPPVCRDLSSRYCGGMDGMAVKSRVSPHLEGMRRVCALSGTALVGSTKTGQRECATGTTK